MAENPRLEALLEAPLKSDGSPRDAWKDQLGFNLFSLGDWLGLCSKASIAHVAAEKITEIDIECLLRSDEHPDHPDVKAFDKTIEAAKKPQTMLRWDACAPEMVKHLLGSGRPEWNQKMLDWFIVDDPRAFDILYEFPDRTITVWRRPWMRTALLDGYPVEYRVFVHDGTVRGVSNYYVQRPLALNGQPCDGIFDDVRKVIAKASALSEALPAPLRYGPAAKHFPADQRSFTADFMRLDDGELTFLEGGPPFGAGAHPCCFPADTRRWDLDAAWECEGIPVALVDVGPESGHARPRPAVEQ